MTDLYLASAISLTLSALLCALSLRIAAHLSRLTATVVILIAVAALFTYAVFLHDDLRVANFLPFSSAIILGNPTPSSPPSSSASPGTSSPARASAAP